MQEVAHVEKLIITATTANSWIYPDLKNWAGSFLCICQPGELGSGAERKMFARSIATLSSVDI